MTSSSSGPSTPGSAASRPGTAAQPVRGTEAGRPRERRSPLRQGTAAVLVLLFALLLPLTLTVTWAHRTVLNNEAWIRTVTPIASDPAVTAAVSRQVTDQLYTTLDPQAVVAEALPPKAAFLAGPITNGARSYIQQAVDKLLQSDQFQQLWVSANATAHAQLVQVLRGHSEVVKSTNGTVVLNLVPLLSETLKNLEGFVSSVVGRPVSIPQLSSDEVPSAACAKLSLVLRRELPSTCGQVPLFPSNQLDTAQRAVRAFDRTTVALLVVTPLVAAGALAVSRRRRRTLLQLTIGAMLGLVVFRRSTMWLQDRLVATGKPENKAARSAIVNDVFDRFFTLSAWFLVAGAVVVLLALVTGPYAWAVTSRQRAAAVARTGAHLVSAGAGAATTRAGDEATVAWIRAHLDALRVGGVVVAVLLLLVVNVNLIGLLVLAGLLALYELWLSRLRPPTTITLPDVPRA
jgi:hypothetical protein